MEGYQENPMEDRYMTHLTPSLNILTQTIMSTGWNFVSLPP